MVVDKKPSVREKLNEYKEKSKTTIDKRNEKNKLKNKSNKKIKHDKIKERV